MVVNSSVLSADIFDRSRHDLTIVYDGECPFCANYVRLHRLRTNIGSVSIVNAREHITDAGRAKQAGLNVDESMLVFWRDKLYTEGDAVRILTKLGSRRIGFTTIAGLLFLNSKAAQLLYPVLRSGRNLTLRLLGRRKIFPRAEERSPR
jgi:predicted DCC family thiol-disulfide oxidoreductase YuxK